MDDIFLEISSKIDSALDTKLDKLHLDNKDLFLCSKFERFRADEAFRKSDNLSCEVGLLERVINESKAIHQSDQRHLVMKCETNVQRLKDELDGQQRRLEVAENQLKTSLENETALRKVIKEQELIIQSDVSRKKLEFLENENNELIIELKKVKDEFDDKEMDWKRHYAECPKIIKSVMEKYSLLKKESQDSKQGYEKLIDALTKDCQRLRDEIQSCLKTFKSEKSEFTKTKTTLKAEIDSMKTKVSKYKVKNKELSGSLEKKENIAQQLTKDLEVLRTECSNLKSNLENQGESLKLKTREYKELRESKKSWQKKSESYKGKYKHAKDELAKYQNENEKLNRLSGQPRAESLTNGNNCVRNSLNSNQCYKVSMHYQTEKSKENLLETGRKTHTNDTVIRQNDDYKNKDFVNPLDQAEMSSENASDSIDVNSIRKSTGKNEDSVQNLTQQFEESSLNESTRDVRNFKDEDSPADIRFSSKRTSNSEIDANGYTRKEKESLNVSSGIEKQSNDNAPIENHGVSSNAASVLIANTGDKEDFSEDSFGNFMSNNNSDSFLPRQNDESGTIPDPQETDFHLKIDVHHPYDDVVSDDFFASNNVNFLLTNTDSVEENDEFSGTESNSDGSLDSMGSDEMATAIGCGSPGQAMRNEEELMIREEEIFMQDYVEKIKRKSTFSSTQLGRSYVSCPDLHLRMYQPNLLRLPCLSAPVKLFHPMEMN